MQAEEHNEYWFLHVDYAPGSKLQGWWFPMSAGSSPPARHFKIFAGSQKSVVLVWDRESSKR
jgi:hypothetical protein